MDNVVGVVKNSFMQPTQTSSSACGSGVKGGRERSCLTERLRKSLLLAYLCSRAIIGLLNILVDIGVPAEKEVIQ